MSERLDELESRLAFQDQLLEELNQVVSRQDGEILRLKNELKILKGRVQELNAAMPGQTFNPDDEVPPHY